MKKFVVMIVYRGDEGEVIDSHDTLDLARSSARDMACDNPGDNYVVLEARYHIQLPVPTGVEETEL